MTDAATDPYAALAAVIERELQAVGERDFAALAECKTARGAIVRTLPATPPAWARDALRRCELLQTRVRIELMRVRDEILFELRIVGNGQRAAAGYAPRRPSAHRLSTSA